ncbi:MAG: hypothetical protein LBH30_00515 [Prevotellaceae bacterium]|nr:hypothetical protein [Prevotellaceae bacterium]
MNEASNPSTVFNEGENFSFYFKCTNLSAGREIKVSGDFLAYLINNGFCRVISQQNDTIGYPCKSGFGTDRFDTFPFYGENSNYEIIVPWSDSREGWSDNLSCYYESLHRDNLSKDKYYMEFTHEFRFYSKQNEIYNIPVSFKINFEIK